MNWSSSRSVPINALLVRDRNESRHADLLAVAMGSYAITLNIKIFWGIFILAMASSWLLKGPKVKHVPTLY